MGGDYYESHHSILEHEMMGKPRIGIGQNTRIENAIIDKNARIGDNVRISPAGKPENVDHALYYIRDGIVIIPKNGVIPHGMVILGAEGRVRNRFSREEAQKSQKRLAHSALRIQHST